MKHIILFMFAAMALILSSSQCKKGGEEFGPDDTYFRCKINGQTYIPNNCANCTSAKLLGDTTFLLNGNAGFESVAIGVINETGNVIKPSSYILNQNPRSGADYKNSTIYLDQYNTDSQYTGELIINTLDKTNRIVEGTFNFKAFNTYRNDSVNITDGRFRLKYTTN